MCSGENLRLLHEITMLDTGHFLDCFCSTHKKASKQLPALKRAGNQPQSEQSSKGLHQKPLQEKMCNDRRNQKDDILAIPASSGNNEYLQSTEGYTRSTTRVVLLHS